MKRITLTLALLVLLAIGFLFCLFVAPALDDPLPTKAEMGGTLVFSDTGAPSVPLPSPSLPVEKIAEPEQDITQPLPKDLITLEPATGTVNYGVVTIPRGSKVKLVKDTGERVTVRMQSLQTILPRKALVGAPEQPRRELPVVGNVVQVVRTIVEAPTASLGIQAKEVGTEKLIDHKWETDYGSYDRNYHRSKGIEVTVHNFSRRSTGNLEIAVYWVARRLSDRALYVHHCETFPTDLDAGKSFTVSSTCPQLLANGQFNPAQK